MKRITCQCGQSILLKKMPRRPFITCPACGLRVPVHCDPSDFMKKCPKCGRYVEPEAFSIHKVAWRSAPTSRAKSL